MRQLQKPFGTFDITPTLVEEMAESLREANALKGFADTHDLLVQGWPQRQIDLYGADAVVLAAKRSSRDRDACQRKAA